VSGSAADAGAPALLSSLQIPAPSTVGPTTSQAQPLADLSAGSLARALSTGASGQVSPLVGGVSNSAAAAAANGLPSGWTVRGAGSVAGDTVTLQEDDRLLTSVSRLLEVSEGMTSLQFTIRDARLGPNGPLEPPDAFEVALLDADTMQPLVGTAAGLSQTDALLNVQQTGEFFFGPRVTVSGVSGSGQVASLASPLTVTVDLHGIRAGTRALLFLDLLGFGSTASSVVVSFAPPAAQPPDTGTGGGQPGGGTGTPGGGGTSPGGGTGSSGGGEQSGSGTPTMGGVPSGPTEGGASQPGATSGSSGNGEATQPTTGEAAAPGQSTGTEGAAGATSAAGTGGVAGAPTAPSLPGSTSKPPSAGPSAQLPAVNTGSAVESAAAGPNALFASTGLITAVVDARGGSALATSVFVAAESTSVAPPGPVSRIPGVDEGSGAAADEDSFWPWLRSETAEASAAVGRADQPPDEFWPCFGAARRGLDLPEIPSGGWFQPATNEAIDAIFAEWGLAPDSGIGGPAAVARHEAAQFSAWEAAALLVVALGGRPTYRPQAGQRRVAEWPRQGTEEKA
jgi:hypothetical protein